MIENLAWLPYVTAFVVGVPALVGAGLIFAAARRWSKLRALAASGQRATAQVVDNQLESWSDGRTAFRPVVTFQASSGQEVTTVLADLGGFRSHLVGTEIDVLYDPQKPTEAAPVRKGNTRLIITLVFGLIFLTFSLCAYQMADLVLSEFRDFGGFSDSGDPGDFRDPDFNFDEFDGP
ncbi:DUF3592 domain-containing protein [Micromonospora sp. DT53]|uniref:DUF3592 domain-containing protein n=1 Tax=unclassified Micromonospora TaxID=2617518 RepID=UPI0030E48A60|nr:DUF3592 domain-containing protein [Micromonospora sp. NBC_01638]